MRLQEIQHRLGEIEQRMSAIAGEVNAEGVSAERLAELNTEVDTLTQERSTLQAESIRLRTVPDNQFKPVVPTQPTVDDEDPYGTLEYRKAFKNFVMRGVMSPALQVRADQSTTKANISSVIIPTTITSKLFERNPQAGALFARVTKTTYQTGIDIPALTSRYDLEWVAENNKAERKGAATGVISFKGYKAQIRTAISLEAATMSLDVFEAKIVEAMLEAFAYGFDKAIVAGSGTGQPQGILTAAVYTGSGAHAVKVNNKTVSDYAEWVKIWAKIPLRKQSRAKLHINKSDWQAKILGMKDDTGKCIALETIGFGGAPVYTFMGREVVILEDQGLTTFDAVVGNATASKSTAFAFFFVDEDYYFNSNMQMTYKSYEDNESDETVHKITAIADGKPVDTTSLVVVCRGVDA